MQIFGKDVSLIRCWSHMCHNVAKNLCLVAAEFYDDIIDNIDILQLTFSKDGFVPPALCPCT